MMKIHFHQIEQVRIYSKSENFKAKIFVTGSEKTNHFAQLLFLCNSQKTEYLYMYTVFPRSEAVATNFFTLQEAVATIRGRRLFEGGVN